MTPSGEEGHRSGVKILERLSFLVPEQRAFPIRIFDQYFDDFLEQYSDNIFSRYFLYEMVVIMALYPCIHNGLCVFVTDQRIRSG
jgi:hypothetical protein